MPAPSPAQPHHRRARVALMSLGVLAVALAGCQRHVDKPVVVDLIGSEQELARPQPGNVSIAARTLLGATAQGLLTFDAQGEIVGGIAESWIVADNGQSYMFRLKRLDWSDGKPVRADEVATILEARFRAVPDMLGGLTPQVRAMTDRVIEIRIDTPVPAFIQLLASQRIPILKATPFVGTGPYGATIRLDRAWLKPLPDPLATPEERAEPERNRDLRVLEAARPALAVMRFQRGLTDLVLGGRFQDLPLIGVADLREASVRADPLAGLFGLLMAGNSPLLADASVRDAISAAIDREGMASAFNLSGWTVSGQILPGQLDLAAAPTAPLWAGNDLEARRAAARTAVAAWVARHGVPPVLRVALPQGSGARLLYFRLAADLRQIGLSIAMATDRRAADLILIDEVAPFDSAHWYLARLACASGPGCDPQALERLAAARGASDAGERARLLGEAEVLIARQGNFVPLGMPIRWSLVARRLTGFQASPRGVHPLNQLLPAPN